GRYGVQWKQLGAHNKHLSVPDFEKQEWKKEVAEMEQKFLEVRKNCLLFFISRLWQEKKRSRYRKRARQFGRR
ncbi:MAG: hypothetical protein K2G39_03510, partial [Lachnospiraceae bacterium]|nr:hypothetical protein [Lachnospiraceae bacterium]